MKARRNEDVTRVALRLLARKCPRLATRCYWAGTAAIAAEELHHRRSFDLDFHTREALYDVRPLLAEIQAAFPKAFEIVKAPDEFGSGFDGVLTLPTGERITVQVLSNYEDVRDTDLVRSATAPSLRRVSLSRYLADKVQCIAERTEARDLVDVLAVVRKHPAMAREVRRLLREQDAILLAERLMAWSDAAIEKDLLAYDDVSADSAKQARDLLLKWIKTDCGSASP
jgi:hypothetical protein